MKTATAYESMTAGELIGELARRLHKPPLFELRDRMRELPAAIRVPLLVFDFDCEVPMQGIFGFLENSAGYYLAETIEAFATIGAHRTAATMRRIQAILARHGIDRGSGAPGPRQLETLWTQGAEAEAIREEIETEADRLYMCTGPDSEDSDDVYGGLVRFVEENRDAVVQVICSCDGTE
jgi:hypothetical protein